MSDRKTFYHFVIPSLGSSMITALYFVVDGIFVGRGVGTNALAAVNLSLPVIILIISITMMLTMGGATLTSISIGEKDPAAANQSFRTTISMVVVFAVLISVLCAAFPKTVATISGANEVLLEDTSTYIRYYCLFGVFYCFAMCLSVFVRNDNNPRLALWGMVTGACTNIFLDWLFIFPLQMGLMGAAIASGIGQAISCLLLMTHFFRKKGILRFGWFQLSGRLCLQVARRGIPEFFTQMSQTVTIFIYNILALRYLGEMGVAAYAVVCYLLEIIIASFIGVSQGIQPLISYSYGEKNHQRERYFFRQGLFFNTALALAVYLIMVVLGRPIISIFNPDPELIRLAYSSILVYGVSFAFAAINIVFTTYYLATKRTGRSIMIAAGRSFVLNSICIFAMPAIFGPQALWSGIIVAEFVLAAICLLTRPKNQLTKQQELP